MLRKVKVGTRGSKLRGVGEITRLVSNGRRTYAELFMDYDENCQSTSTRLFVSTVPVPFQFRVNELAEIYTDPKKASHNHYRRILQTITNYDLLELSVDVSCTESWSIRFSNLSAAQKSMTIAIGLPVKGAFLVQALETGRSFIVGRDEYGNVFTVDSMRSLKKYGIDPF